MTCPTNAMIADAITLVLGKPGPLRSTQVDAALIDRQAFHLRCRRWAHNGNIVSFDVGPKITDGQPTDCNALRAWVSEKVKRADLSHPMPKVLRHEAFPDIPTDVVDLDTAQSLLGHDTANTVFPGATCSKNNDVPGTGTIALVGQFANELYGVTAGHVFGSCDPGGEAIQLFGAGTQTAPFTRPSLGQLSEDDLDFDQNATLLDCDAAAFKFALPADLTLNPHPFGLPPIRGVGEPNRLSHGDHVRLFGGTSQELVVGRVFARNRPVLGRATLDDYEVEDCIEVRWRQGQHPAPGDSGSVVIGNDGLAIGVLIGANDVRGFLVPLTTVLERLSLEPVFE